MKSAMTIMNQDETVSYNSFLTPKISDEEAKDIVIPKTRTKNILPVVWKKIPISNPSVNDKAYWILRVEDIEFAKLMYPFDNLPAVIRHPEDKKRLLKPGDFKQIEDIMNHHRWHLEDADAKTTLILTKKIEEEERELAKLAENLD